MILYLETSAMLKLYIDEPGSADVISACEQADVVSTHDIAYVESCAGLAKAVRMKRITLELAKDYRAILDRNWRAITVVSTTEHIIRRAGDLALEFNLRGYDSIHMAAAESLKYALPSEAKFRMIVFDRALINAAEHLGIPSS